MSTITQAIADVGPEAGGLAAVVALVGLGTLTREAASPRAKRNRARRRAAERASGCGTLGDRLLAFLFSVPTPPPPLRYPDPVDVLRRLHDDRILRLVFPEYVPQEAQR